VEFHRIPATDILRSLNPLSQFSGKRQTGMLHREVPRARRDPMTIAIDYRPGHQRRWESCVTRKVSSLDKTGSDSAAEGFSSTIIMLKVI